jgi:hypothetical protein
VHCCSFFSFEENVFFFQPEGHVKASQVLGLGYVSTDAQHGFSYTSNPKSREKVVDGVMQLSALSEEQNL